MGSPLPSPPRRLACYRPPTLHETKSWPLVLEGSYLQESLADLGGHLQQLLLTEGLGELPSDSSEFVKCQFYVVPGRTMIRYRKA